MAIHIGTNRECFFDTYLIDKTATTAEFRVHEPIPREIVMTHGEEWEGDGTDYHNFFFEESYYGIDGKNKDGTYRMYYLGWRNPNHAPNELPIRGFHVCYAESADGLHWIKPNLGISEFNGNKDNNIVFGDEFAFCKDNFMVFKDTNPACPPDKLYKGIASYKKKESDPQVLYAWYSPDGLHFGNGELITDKGYFDTLNVIFWDENAKVYRGYIRGFHDIPADGNQLNGGIRDIRYMESKDFKTWTDPIQLDFYGSEDYPVYTNEVVPYFRAPQMLVGFPTRYMEHKAWNANFDELCGSEKRKERMIGQPRMGLAVTDCVFMCSRDGQKFNRYDDVFIRPGAENGKNWVYGDAYPARGFAVTPAEVEGADPELSMYVPRNSWMNIPAELQRYSLRMDGFVSLHAGYQPEKKVVTKPFIFTGSNLYCNFATSARGYLYFTIRSEDTAIESCETFGDSTDRHIIFGRNKEESQTLVGLLSGKVVTMEIRMRDADVYAIRFE